MSICECFPIFYECLLASPPHVVAVVQSVRHAATSAVGLLAKGAEELLHRAAVFEDVVGEALVCRHMYHS